MTAQTDSGENKTNMVFVTGVAGAIGECICRNFKNKSWRVIGLDRDMPGHNAPDHIERVDLCDLAAARGSLETLFDQHGTPSLLINNAGVYTGRNWRDATAEGFDAIFNTNVRAPFFLSQAYAKAVERTDGASGAIINIASITARLPGDDLIYAASKAALVSITRRLAHDLAPRIRVSAVAPGVIQTAMADKIPPAGLAAYKAKIPMQRLGAPEEVAAAVDYLASPEAAYANGAVLALDGGIL